MKKILLLFLICVASVSSVFSQVKNGNTFSFSVGPAFPVGQFERSSSVRISCLLSFRVRGMEIYAIKGSARVPDNLRVKPLRGKALGVITQISFRE